MGVRLALSSVKEVSDDQVERIVAGQPYTSLQDLWQRARPARPTAEHLAHIGALKGSLTRRDLLLQIAELHRHARGRQSEGQLPLETSLMASEPSGLPEMTGREALGAELDVLGIDVSRHLMEHHHRLLREIGATDSAHLGHLRSGQTVLVAGVRASTQTPPIRSGRRIIFVTLEDGSGLVDLAFFEDSHPACTHTVFHSVLLPVRGVVQRRGPRNTVVGTMVWTSTNSPRYDVTRARKQLCNCWASAHHSPHPPNSSSPSALSPTGPAAPSSTRGPTSSPRYLFRGPARGPLASGPGMTVAPCRSDDLGGGVTGPERRRWRR